MTRGEGKAVIEAVDALHEIFADDVMRGVAVIAGRDMAMASFHPCIKLWTHRMAIHTGLGIAAEVGVPLRIDEGINAQACGKS